MPLIDTDTLNVRKYTRWFDDPCDVRTVERMLREAQKVDPVHAAGGCYCKECVHAMECVGQNGPGLFCSKHKGDWPQVGPGDFCSRGKKKECGDEGESEVPVAEYRETQDQPEGE